MLYSKACFVSALQPYTYVHKLLNLVLRCCAQGTQGCCKAGKMFLRCYSSNTCIYLANDGRQLCLHLAIVIHIIARLLQGCAEHAEICTTAAWPHWLNFMMFLSVLPQSSNLHCHHSAAVHVTRRRSHRGRAVTKVD